MGKSPLSGTVDIARSKGKVDVPSGAWRLLIAISAMLAVAFWLITIRLTGSNLLNAFPFMSPDGYDYLFEGYVLSRWSQGAPLISFPVLRNPLFVLTTFVDYLMGGGGYFALAVISGGLFLLFFALIFAARRVSAPVPKSAVVLWSVAVSPLAFFRSFILADLLATALMIAAVALLVPYYQTGGKRWLVGATITAAAAGLTQFYGVVPFLVVGGWLLLDSLRKRKPERWVGAALIANVVIVLSIHALWRLALPHESVPFDLHLFALSFDMGGAYLTAWAFAFGGMLPVFILVLGQRWRAIVGDPLRLGCWLAFLALVFGNFFYQWEDLRFTHPTGAMFALALLVSLGARDAPRRRRVTVAVFASSALLVTVIGLGIAPSSYWLPRVTEMEFAPGRTWLAGLLRAEQVDRFGIPEHCGNEAVFCDAVPLSHISDPYEQAILTGFKEATPG